jgi:hypothetical protein
MANKTELAGEGERRHRLSVVTVTGTDPDDGEVRARGHLAAPLLAEIRGALADITSAAGWPAFVLVRLDDTGLRASAVDAETGERLIELSEPLVEPAALDRMLADHLVRNGRAKSPQTRSEALELIGLMPLVRIKLAGASGAFVIGRNSVGLVRVTHHDLDEALAPALSRAASLARSVAMGSPQRVTSVVVMPGHTRWPGLLEGLTAAMGSQRVGRLPVVALRAVPLRQSLGRHDAEWSTNPDAGAIAPNRRTRFYLPAPAAPDPEQAKKIRTQNRKVLAGAVAAALIAIGGAAAWAAPWQGSEHVESRPLSIERVLEGPADPPSPTIPAPQAPSPTRAVPAAPVAPPTTVIPPIDTARALAPAVQYEAPAAPPPSAPRQESQAPPPPRQAPPAPAPRTLPNPIPGLPPILLP